MNSFQRLLSIHLGRYAMDVTERSHATGRPQTTKHWWWRLDDDHGIRGGGSGGGDGDDSGGGGGSGGGGSGGDSNTDAIGTGTGGGSPPPRPLDEASVGPSTRRGALTALLQCIRGGHVTCRCSAHGPALPGLVGQCGAATG
jgi:hypothetical protein